MSAPQDKTAIVTGAAKVALIQLAKIMAIDHASQNIRVNSISPGPPSFWQATLPVT